MAIFSSTLAAQTISAPPTPDDLNEKLPDIKFRGTDCRSLTVTLENSVVYKNSSNQKINRRMQKIYKVESNAIHSMSIEVKLEISTAGVVTENLDTVFRISVDPHQRTGAQRSHPNSTSSSIKAPLPNPRFFKNRSVGTEPEEVGWYEAYNLYLYNFKKNKPTLYAKLPSGTPSEKLSPEYYLDHNELLVECRKIEPVEKDPVTGKDKTKWSFMTVGSLLSDVLTKCPSFFLRLCIVGNYQFDPPTQTAVTKADGGIFEFKATGVLPTDGSPPTPAQDALDTEIKWNQFLVARAEELKKTVFGSRVLPIVTSPAIKITPTSGGDTILNEDWNDLATLFQLPNETPDIATLKSLRLEKAKFGAGSIFLWIIASLHDTEINFQTNEAIVYPAVDKDEVGGAAKLTKYNLEKINKLRKDLFFLAPGSNPQPQFTTNLTDLSLRVEGYTDTVSTMTDNQNLSKNRASSVIQELKTPTKALPTNVGGGIPAGNFNPAIGKGYGETRLRIWTPDETPELMNRRVLIRVVGITCT